MQTQNTRECYLRRAQQLTRRAVQATGQAVLKAIQIAEWLVTQRDQLSKATWRQYKAALVFTFEQCEEKNSLVADDTHAAIALLMSTAPPAQHCSNKRTSA